MMSAEVDALIVLTEHRGRYRKRVLGQARLKGQKIDVLQYPGEEIPAGTICLARYSYQIQRDSLATPQLC